MSLKILKTKSWKPKMLGICKHYCFILLEPMKSIKNEQNMHRYQIKTGRTGW